MVAQHCDGAQCHWIVHVTMGDAMSQILPQNVASVCYTLIEILYERKLESENLPNLPKLLQLAVHQGLDLNASSSPQMSYRFPTPARSAWCWLPLSIDPDFFPNKSSHPHGTDIKSLLVTTIRERIYFERQWMKPITSVPSRTKTYLKTVGKKQKTRG